MRKVKVVTTKYGICVCLDNSLFKNESEQIIKISKMLSLFSDTIERYEGTIFINFKDGAIINDLYNMNCSFELISTTKDLLNRDKEENYKILFKNDQIEQIICFLLKNNLTFDGNGYTNNDGIFSKIVINDHDGSYITINHKVFEKENYKQLIINIFKN